jgi:hypothetical protein
MLRIPSKNARDQKSMPVLKVSKSRKQIMASWILPKEELRTPCFFRDLLTLQTFY